MKRIGSLLAVLGAIAYGSTSFAFQGTCIDDAEYELASKTYADLTSKFDLLSVGQDLYDLSIATRDLKGKLTDCRGSLKDSDPHACDELLRQYEATRARRDSLTTRFNAATDMQDFLLDLKQKLSQPRCRK